MFEQRELRRIQSDFDFIIAATGEQDIGLVRGWSGGDVYMTYVALEYFVDLAYNRWAMSEVIKVVGAREHNLKNISVEIPRDKLVVITGLSGSGKSSLAFDTIYAEGQRRYVESLSSSGNSSSA